jgi:hypothetical protein
MIGADDEAMIMDFGIARSTGAPVPGPMPGANTIVPQSESRRSEPPGHVARGGRGHSRYMAPEQAKGVHVDQRADVYAFGLILYDMLVGQPRAEHAGSAITELQGRMQHAPPPVKSVVPDVPDHVDQIIGRCLEPDPDKRFQTSEELSAALALLDDNGVPIPIPPRFSKQMIAAAAVAVITLVTGTWWFTRTPPPVKPHDPVTRADCRFREQDRRSNLRPHARADAQARPGRCELRQRHDRTRLRAAFGIAPPEKLDEAAARQIATKQALGVVVSGSIDRKGSGYEVAVKAAEPVTGNVVAEAKRSASARTRSSERSRRSRPLCAKCSAIKPRSRRSCSR